MPRQNSKRLIGWRCRLLCPSELRRRFSSPDPLSGSTGDPQSLNHYAYVENDPINYVDPTGLDTCNLGAGVTQTNLCNVQLMDGGNENGISSLDWIITSYVPAGSVSEIVGNQPDGTPDYYPAILDFLEDSINDSRGSNNTGKGGAGGSSIQAARNAFCSGIPSGRLASVGGAMGAVGAVSGSISQVVNYDSGQVSDFATGGLQLGWNGAASGSVSAGFTFGNLGDSNSNFSGKFIGGQGGSSEGPGGMVSMSPNASVVVAASSMNVSLIPGPTGGGLLTVTTAAVPAGNVFRNAGNNVATDILDLAMFAIRQMVCH